MTVDEQQLEIFRLRKSLAAAEAERDDERQIHNALTEAEIGRRVEADQRADRAESALAALRSRVEAGIAEHTQTANAAPLGAVIRGGGLDGVPVYNFHMAVVRALRTALEGTK